MRSMIVGSPTVGTHMVTTQGNSNYIVTAVTPNADKEYTLVAIGSAQSVEATPIISNYSYSGGIALNLGTASGSSDIYIEAGCQATAGSGYYHRVQLTPGAPAGNEVFGASVFRTSGPLSERISAYDLKNDLKSSVPNRSDLTEILDISAGGQLRLGDHVVSLGSGKANIRSAWVFERALTEEELLVLGSYLRDYYWRRGIAL